MMDAAVVASEHVIVVPAAVRLIPPPLVYDVRKLVYEVHSESVLEMIPEAK